MIGKLCAMLRRAAGSTLLVATLAGGCGTKTETQPKAEAKGTEPPAEAKDASLAEAAPPAMSEADPDRPPKAEPMTPEELELIEKDPKDLTPELRRKRAFALRKKIMQNPDSPQARELWRLQKAVESGELQVPSQDQLRAQSRTLHANPPKEPAQEAKEAPGEAPTEPTPPPSPER